MGCYNSSTVLRYATDDDSSIDNTWNIIDYYKLGHKANAIGHFTVVCLVTWP